MQAGAVADHCSVGQLAGQARPYLTTQAPVTDKAEDSQLVATNSLRERPSQLLSANPLERLTGEISRRATAVGTVSEFLLA